MHGSGADKYSIYAYHFTHNVACEFSMHEILSLHNLSLLFRRWKYGYVYPEHVLNSKDTAHTIIIMQPATVLYKLFLD